MKNIVGLVASCLVGAVAAGTAVLFTAPDSGANTRKKVQKLARRRNKDIQNELKRLQSKAQKADFGVKLNGFPFKKKKSVAQKLAAWF